MNPIEIIKEYIEDKLSTDLFWEELYNNKELQNLLDSETSIPSYARGRSLLLYILSQKKDDLGFIMNVKDSLSQFLKKSNVVFQYSTLETDKYNILLEAQPKWLQTPNWQFEGKNPLLFIGEIDISEIEHDVTKVYVFYDKGSNSFKCVKQSV